MNSKIRTLLLNTILGAATFATLALASGCNAQDACNQAKSADTNLQSVLVALKASPSDADLQSRLCPWIKKSELPYLKALAIQSKKLSDRINTGPCNLFGAGCESVRAMFSAQGLSEQLDSLVGSLEHTCLTSSSGADRAYYSGEAQSTIVNAIPQYTTTLKEYGGCSR